MQSLIKLVRIDFLPTSADVGLLFLRSVLGVSMYLLHGQGKLNTFADPVAVANFPDPFGVGHTTSLVLAIIGEVLCSILLCFGFLTRLAALGSAVTMGVAFVMVHHAQFGDGGGELSFIYLTGYLAILIAGPGRFSLDARVFGTR